MAMDSYSDFKFNNTVPYTLCSQISGAKSPCCSFGLLRSRRIFFLLILLLIVVFVTFQYVLPISQRIAFKSRVSSILQETERDSTLLQKYNYKIQREGNSSSECPFPILDPFDPRVQKYTKKYEPLTCTGNSPNFVEVKGQELIVNSTQLEAKLNLKSIHECKYRSIKMKSGDDFNIKYGEWSETFTKSIQFQDDDDVIQVDCSDKSDLVSRSYLALVRKNNDIEKKRLEDYKTHVQTNSPKETLSVLFVGVDGTSLANFIRAMPKTRKFILENLNAIEYKKFNKVGLNTFPNVLPLLTGNSEEDIANNWNHKVFFDKIDNLFLWNGYRKAGYRTALMFDNVEFTAFHYLKKGWSKPPVDFYPRPIVVASETDSYYRKPSRDCMGDGPEATQILDYWLQLTTLYNNTPSTPYFAYSFLSRLTHDDANGASRGDEIYLSFFEELTRRNVLNNTLTIFFSDHGERFGAIRNTYYGVVAAKLPFLYFMFPPWFERKYPLLIKKFRTNADRLMTTFDIHATLKELLNFTGKSQMYSPVSRGISLFSEIPTNRTCDVAGIPLRYCACVSLSYKNTTSLSARIALAEYLLKSINDFIYEYRHKCEILQLKDTMNVIELETETGLKEKTEKLYLVTIETIPGNAVFEATILFNSADDDLTLSLMDNVARLNLYRGQAECIDSQKHRPFCFCKKL